MNSVPDRNEQDSSDRTGFAVLLALIATSLFSLIGLYLAMAAVTEVRASDNFEGFVRARVAAQAGLNHAHALMKGLRFDDLLPGPDGIHSGNPAYVLYARTYGYRNPLGWPAARIVDVFDPSAVLIGMSDDGILNTGAYPGGNGTALIPLAGVVLTVPDWTGPGRSPASRYFVKISDNNGEASELAQDPADNPFVDGDGQIIVRSMGVAPTIREDMTVGRHANSVALLEARFKRFFTFDLEAALLVQGATVSPGSGSMFDGNLFLVQGGPANAGIATIDAPAGSGNATALQIRAQTTPGNEGCIQGAGPAPSIRDITGLISAHPDKRLLLNQSYVWSFLQKTVPLFADNHFLTSQTWLGTMPGSLGSYDETLPPAFPGQNPKVTYVNGDLILDGNLEGGGLLIVTGKLRAVGQFRFCGLILVAGAGELEIGGTSSITGAIYVAAISDASGTLNWGTARLTLRDGGRILFNREAVRMAVSLIPAVQLGFREITSIIDP